MSKHDAALVHDVTNELAWDPKVDNASVAVDAEEGRVTLRGTVGSLREKREAKTAAERVAGVVSVDNQLQVRLMSDGKRADSELRGDILQALMLDSLVPSTVDVKVESGFATLTGSADWQYQRDEAVLVASNIVGTLDVYDAIELEHPEPSADAIAGSIESAFKRNAVIDAHRVHVSSSDGSVTIKGKVRSWAEHDQAIGAAWSAPGVTEVHDHLKVRA